MTRGQQKPRRERQQFRAEWLRVFGRTSKVPRKSSQPKGSTAYRQVLLILNSVADRLSLVLICPRQCICDEAAGNALACEQALLFGQAKRASRERASEGPRKGELARRLVTPGTQSRTNQNMRLRQLELNLSQRRRHAGVKTRMSNVAGHFCAHIGTVSEAVPAAMSQVHRRHMRTRLLLMLVYRQVS